MAKCCCPTVRKCIPVQQNHYCSALTANADAVFSYEATYKIPFGKTASASGCAIAHATNSPDFVVTEGGEYTIEYQLSADNPAVASGLPIDQTVELVSAISGVVDMFHFTGKNQIYTKKLVVNLQAGDALYLRATQPKPAEMHFNNLALSIAKKC